jgi:hypothetical protein
VRLGVTYCSKEHISSFVIDPPPTTICLATPSFKLGHHYHTHTHHSTFNKLGTTEFLGKSLSFHILVMPGYYLPLSKVVKCRYILLKLINPIMTDCVLHMYFCLPEIFKFRLVMMTSHFANLKFPKLGSSLYDSR